MCPFRLSEFFSYTWPFEHFHVVCKTRIKKTLRNSPLRKRQKCDSTWDNINITVVRFPDDGTLDVPIVLPSDKNNIGNCQSTKK